MAVVLETLARLDAERARVIRNGEKGLRTEAQVDQRLAEIDAELVGPRNQKAALDMQFRSASRLANHAELASIGAADIAEQLDLINAGCASANPVERRKARALKAAQIQGAVTRIEVRTGEDKLPHLRVFLRLGGMLAVRSRTVQEATDNEQQEDNDLIIVTEIAIPRGEPGPRKVSRLAAAYGIV
jgi:hypothetical protein